MSRAIIIERLKYALTVCDVTGTPLVHMSKADAEEILDLLREQEGERIRRCSYEASHAMKPYCTHDCNGCMWYV